MARKVFVFVPGFGQIVSAATWMTTHALQGALFTKGIMSSYSTLSFPDIAELRNMVFTIWHDTMPDCDHLLFIDSDMGFSPDLVLDMILFNEPIVGTIYPQRKLPQSWAGSGNGGAVSQRRGDFMEVEGVGFGCTLIRRDVAQIMLAQMPELVDNRLHLHPAGEMLKGAGAHRMIRAFEKLDIPERGLVSEDLSFCIRWGRCTMPDGSKGKVWANIGHRMSHVGPFDYSGRYLDVVEQQQIQEAMARQAIVNPPVVAVGGPVTAAPPPEVWRYGVPGAAVNEVVMNDVAAKANGADPSPAALAALIESIENGAAAAAAE